MASPPPRLEGRPSLEVGGGLFPVLEDVADIPDCDGEFTIGDPPAAAIGQVEPHPEVDVAKCHFVEPIEISDVDDVCFVGGHVCCKDPVEAIADPTC